MALSRSPSHSLLSEMDSLLLNAARAVLVQEAVKLPSDGIKSSAFPIDQRASQRARAPTTTAQTEIGQAYASKGRKAAVARAGPSSRGRAEGNSRRAAAARTASSGNDSTRSGQHGGGNSVDSASAVPLHCPCCWSTGAHIVMLRRQRG